MISDNSFNKTFVIILELFINFSHILVSTASTVSTVASNVSTVSTVSTVHT